MEAMDQAMRLAGELQADRSAGQMNLFMGNAAKGSSAPAPPPDRELPPVPDWPENQVLAFEKETLGFFISSHPLAAHERTLRALSTHTTADLKRPGAAGRVRVGGLLAAVQARFPKNGPNKDRKYARFRIEDFDGTLDGVAFSEAYEKHKEEMQSDRIVFLEGTLAADREEPSLRVDRVIPVEQALESLVSSVMVAAGTQGEGAAPSFRALVGVARGHGKGI